MRLTLATYNVHGCVGADGRRDPGRILDVVEAIDADVIALQEVENRPIGAGDLLGRLATRTGSEVIAGPTLTRRRLMYGNALLTRLPVNRVDRIDLSVTGREPRGAIDAELGCGGRRLRVIATHLGLRPVERREQIRCLLSRLASDRSHLTALAGDLNEWLLWGRPLRWLRRQFPGAANLPTYPARLPVLALDRIWVRPAHCLESLETHDTFLARIASDHLPLKAVASLDRAGRAGRETPRQA